ncbi:uncharacterized protein LOC143199457 isoform X2 [Rhynchophorus ferrugineus]|uniref:uncharacterized protein LOC143199457 isoform X2 n=1 Tax=Rhynchophorus ferrugineus TaxID=354439 RepID=UPI003FCEBC50
MANKDDYLTTYREFFENFARTVNPDDQLPVKLASYKLLNIEVVGAIIDWTTQYLTQKYCPPHLFSPIIKIVIEEIRKVCKKDPLLYGFNCTVNAYEPLKLMQAVMAKANEVCLRYLDNSMLCSLPTPINNFCITTALAVRNKRKTMEDRHVVIHDLNTMFNVQEASPSSYYAVFDGHAGHDAAAYSSAHLHQYLAENKYFISKPEQALIDAFCKTDALFLEKCRAENFSSGTTAVVALLRPKEKSLYIAWVGDSQAIVVNQGKILQCVNPHKPCREDERERIERAGGCVLFWGTWRVNGQLAVSRAIGDGYYKPHVTAIPDVREIPLDGGEDFLILACDGLWDVVSEDRAAQEVYYLVAENPDNTERISGRLVDLAKFQGSTDNISVIVVFLKDPHKIAAEAHRWATRNLSQSTEKMDTELDNANNPFTNSNGTIKNLETDNIHLQKNNDGLLLNLTDNFKSSGEDFFASEKSNGTKRSTSDINSDDDLGPETNIDSVDDAFSPVEKTNSFGFGFSKGLDSSILEQCINDELKNLQEKSDNNNPLNEQFLNKAEADDSKDDLGDDDGDERVDESSRVSPTNEPVHDVSGVEENPADSDSEDEWNYIKGDQTKEETPSSQPETVVETPEDTMSQLNPNAAEFVPISPTRSVPSPTCRSLINEEVLSQSPRRPLAVDINVPNQRDFEKEIKSRPSEVGYSNGVEDNDDDLDKSLTDDLKENMLNGKSIDEIPEFHPGSTPAKLPPAEEFHFGPNAAPFTPKPLDQSEAFSTKANYGDDDVEQTLNESEYNANKESGDPMSMSFYAEKGESNPFEEDLNSVHQLPDDLEEFLQKEDDKPHEPTPLDNDQAAVQITDLDKLSQDDEKELASPLEPDQELDLSKSPEPRLLEDYITSEKITKEQALPDEQVELIETGNLTNEFLKSKSPELCTDDVYVLVSKSPVSDVSQQEFEDEVKEESESKSPLPEVTTNIEHQIRSDDKLISVDIIHSPIPSDVEPSIVEKTEEPISVENAYEPSGTKRPDEPSNVDITDELCKVEKSDELISEDIKHPIDSSDKELLDEDIIQIPSPASKEPVTEDIARAPVSGDEQSDLEVLEQISDDPQHCDITLDKEQIHLEKSVEPISDDHFAQSPVAEDKEASVLEKLVEPICQDILIAEQQESENPVCEYRARSPTESFDELNVCSKEITSDTFETEFNPKSEVEQINLEVKSSELRVSPTPACEYSTDPACELLQSELADLQEQKPEEDITSSVKDDISSPTEQLSPVKSPEPDVMEKERVSPAESPLPVEQIPSEISVSEPKETIEESSSGISCPFVSSQPQAVEEIELNIAPELSTKPDVVNEAEILQQSEVCTEQETAKEPELIIEPQDIEVCSKPVIEPLAASGPELVCESEAPKEPEIDLKAAVAEEPILEKTEISSESEIPKESEVISEVELSKEPEAVLEPVSVEKPEPVQEPELIQTQQFVALESTPIPPTSLSNGIDNLIGEVTEQISIKTENIQPEFAEQTVITPSEESKLLDDVPTAPLVETPVEETKPEPIQDVTEPAQEVAELKPMPEITVKSPEPTVVVSEETPKEIPAVLPLPIKPVVPVEVPKEEAKKEEKKPAASPAKKPIGKVAPSKSSTTASRVGTATKTTTKPLASPKGATAPKVPPKTGTSRLNVGPTKTAAPPTRLSPKPSTATAPKSTERKPITNGDVKSPQRLIKKKPATEAPATKPTARHSLPATKTTTTKTTAPKPTTAPRTTAPRPTASKTATSTTAAKPRTTLSSSKTTTVLNKTSSSTLTATKALPKRPSGATRTSTTTTTKTTLTKKPGEVKTLTKTKTTKVEKPKENGIAPASVTEEIKEITIVTNNVVGTDSLLKDNSPIDNKLLDDVPNQLTQATPAD